jgi:hypothetical protein
VRAVDNAGNVGAWKTIVRYKYDDTAPAQTPTNLITVEWTSKNAGAAIPQTWAAAADDASGIKGYNVRWHNGTPVFQTGTSYTPTALTVAGIYNLEVQTVDNAGNVSDYKTILTYEYDPNAPGQTDTSLTIVEWTSKNASAAGARSWTAADAGTLGVNASGIKGYNVRWNGITTFQTDASYYMPTALSAAGIYNLEVQTVDKADNVSDYKTILTYKYDPDAPRQTVTDLGVLDWTNQSMHIFNWDPVTDLSGIDHYDIHWSATEGTSVTHQTAGAAYTASGLSAGGTYYLRVRTVDGAGNTGVWKTIAKYKYDGAAPDFAPERTTVSWTTQKDCGLVTWTAANDGSGSGVAGYNIYWGKAADGTVVLAHQNGNDAAARGYNPLPCDTGDGVYYLRVQAVDNAGNVSVWKTVLAYQYDAGAPVLPFTNTETEFSADVDRGEFYWNAADDGAGSGVKGYYVYWGVNPNGASANLQTTPAFDPPPCEEYTYYYLRVQAVDNIGNAGEWKTLLSYAFNSSDKPGISMTSKVIGWTKDAKPPSITWASAQTGGPVISGYYVYWGQDSEGRNPDNFREGNGTYDRTYNPPACSADGYWYLRVQAQNAAGNKGIWSTVLTYKYDAAPPGSSPTLPDTDIDWSGSKHPEPFTWEPASDGRGSGVAGYQIYWGLQSSGVSANYYTESNTFVIPELAADGKYYLRVRAIDAAGNTGNWTTVYRYWHDGSAPVFVAKTETVDWTTSPDPPVFNWDEALDGVIGENAGSGVAGYNLYWGDDPDGSAVMLQRSRDNRQYDPPPCGSGDPHYLRIQAVDNVGNTSEWQTVLVYHYDGLPPGISPTEVTVPETNNPYPGIFDWTEADDGLGSGVNGYYVYWGAQPDGEDNSTAAYQHGADKNSFEPPKITNGTGTYYLRVKARDNMGNIGDWTTVLTYHYRYTRPGISATSETTSWTNTADPPPFEWQAVTEAPSGVSGYNIYWGDDSDGMATITTCPKNDRTFDPPPVQKPGLYYLRVQAVDGFGAPGDWATVYVYHYENTPPSGGIMISSDNSEYTLTGNVVLYLNYTDEHSGVAAMNIKLGEDWQGWEAAAPVKTVELPAGDSEKTVSVRYQDAAGNISPEYTASISPNTVPEAASPYIQGSGGTGEKVWSYPNPFSPDNGQAARLAYIVERDGWTRVYVYDARGRRVWQTESFARAGQDNIVLWDGRNNRGQLASNGLYIIIVTTEKNQIISRGRLTLYDE